jgi:glutamyl-tRNA reductase
MVDHYKILTVTHREVPLWNVKNYVLPSEVGMQHLLQRLKSEMGLSELLYLNTCNRVTYFFVGEVALDEAFKSSFFNIVNPDLATDAIEQVAAYEGEAAIKHLFEVAASIDSMVVGEREIFRQLREAYQQCKSLQLTADNIRLAIDFAVRTAKEVYAHTKIGEKPISVVSLAMQKLVNHQLQKDARIVMVGAGQTNRLVGKFLQKRAFGNVTVFNRTINENALDLALSLGGKVFSLDRIKEHKAGFDVLIVCTASAKPIIDEPMYESLLNGDQGRKVVIDLSIPHNVSGEVSNKYNMHYIEIEGLRTLAKENLAQREQEVIYAQKVVHRQLAEFVPTYKQRQMEVAMRALPEEIKAVKERAINEVFRKELEVLDQPAQELMERMMAYMEKKCVGIPMKTVKKLVL